MGSRGTTDDRNCFQVASLKGTNGFTIVGQDTVDMAGQSVASGDVNGDGFADVVIGSHGGDGTSNSYESTGELYLVFGKSGGWEASVKVHAHVHLQTMNGN